MTTTVDRTMRERIEQLIEAGGTRVRATITADFVVGPDEMTTADSVVDLLSTAVGIATFLPVAVVERFRIDDVTPLDVDGT